MLTLEVCVNSLFAPDLLVDENSVTVAPIGDKKLL